MNFHRFISNYDCYRRMCKAAKIPEKPGYKEFFEDALKAIRPTNEAFKQSYNQIVGEYKWYRLGQPYYNLHPGLIGLFARNKLDFPAKYIELPYSVIAIQFPQHIKELALETPGFELRTCFLVKATEHLDLNQQQIVSDETRLTIWIDFGERHKFQHGDDIIFVYRQLMWKGEETVEEALNKLPIHQSYYQGLAIPEDKIILCLKLALSIAFLAKDESPLVVPDILNKDKEQFKTASEEDKKQLHRKATETRDRKGYLVGVDEMFDLGQIGQAAPPTEHLETGRELKYAHIVMGHWQLIRHGPKKEFGRIRWIMPYVRGEGKLFKHEAIK